MTVPSRAATAIRIVLVDDQTMIRSGLRLLLDSERDIEVVGEAGTAARRSRSSDGDIQMSC